VTIADSRLDLSPMIVRIQRRLRRLRDDSLFRLRDELVYGFEGPDLHWAAERAIDAMTRALYDLQDAITDLERRCRLAREELRNDGLDDGEDAVDVPRFMTRKHARYKTDEPRSVEVDGEPRAVVNLMEAVEASLRRWRS